jgi:putative SOS response-associated peptidase YedK
MKSLSHFCSDSRFARTLFKFPADSNFAKQRYATMLRRLHQLAGAEPENRCLVPVNSFAEYAPEPNPETKKKDVIWFALNDDRPLFAFAGIWATFHGDRGTKSKPVPGPHQVYGFLTTSPNRWSSRSIRRPCR